MNETERNETNAATALAGEQPYLLGGVPVRRVSLESLSILERIGSPMAAGMAAAMNGAAAPTEKPGLTDVLVFVWVHAEDADTVLQTALQCSPVFTTPVQEAAIRWSRAQMPNPAQLGDAVAHITAETRALEAAAFRTHAPQGAGGAKKNA